MNNQELFFEQEQQTPLTPYISISQVNGIIGEQFDQLGVATKTYEKHHDNPNSEYYGLSIDEICNRWTDKANKSKYYGSLLDDYIGYNLNNDQMGLEMFLLDHDRDSDERLDMICKSYDEFISDFLSKHPEIKFVTREKTIYYQLENPTFDESKEQSLDNSKYWYVKGRLDALFYNTLTNHYINIDWKSSDKIEHQPNKWTKRLLGPCSSLYDMDWYKYTIQVYFYKTALENGGYLPNGSIVDCYIVQLPGHKIMENNDKMYFIHQPAFQYDLDFMKRIFIYAHKKNILTSKINASKM